MLGMATGGLLAHVQRAVAGEPASPPAVVAAAPATALDSTTRRELAATPATGQPEDDEPPPAPPAPEGIAEPVRVVAPAIDLDAPLVAVGLLENGEMEVPDFGLAGWYSLGPFPGAPGPAVLAGHVDSRSGPDVFYRLRDLAAGDRVEVHGADGESAVFEVTSSEMQLKAELPVDRIWDDSDEPLLRLITCGGDFDRSRRSYRSNVIVYAAYVSGP